MPWSDSLHAPSDDSFDFLRRPEHQAARRRSPAPRPQLTSPRLLRGALDTSASPSSPALPQPVNFHTTFRDVEQALHNADMAMRNVRAAFSNGMMATSNHANGGGSVVDLTGSSDDIHEDTFMTQTRRPHESAEPSRPANPMNEPAYYSRHGATSNTVRIPSIHTLLGPTPPPVGSGEADAAFLGSMRQQATDRAEASAVHRQRQARRSWLRVERRNRERAQQQSQREEQERTHRNETRQDPGQTRRRSLPTGRRNEDASDSTSSSGISSISSDSESESHIDELAAIAQSTNMPAQAIDLTSIEDAKALDSAIAKAQQDAIAAQSINPQNLNDKSRSALSNYKCAICMDSPTNLTSTICGHLFCHRCIIDSLKWSERQRAEDHHAGRRVQGLCPVCRKPLQLKEATTSGRGTSGGIVNLEIKRMPRKQYLENKKRGKFLKSFEKGKQRAKTEEEDAEAGSRKIKVDTDEDAVKMQGLALSRGRRKRKRENDTTDQRQSQSADADSLFGSP